uniref:Uncharacterized protein n=1 Tax=Megaselia scalaris TaxID=36166 RepID=T1GPI4_MEGSC
MGVSALLEFFNYWWTRYLLTTELYMVEKWERVTIHVIFFILFMLIWYFNYSIVLSLTSNLLVTPVRYLLSSDTETSPNVAT